MPDTEFLADERERLQTSTGRNGSHHRRVERQGGYSVRLCLTSSEYALSRSFRPTVPEHSSSMLAQLLTPLDDNGGKAQARVGKRGSRERNH